MSFYSIDIEADGPIPGKYSMVSFGAVKVNGDLKETFYAEIQPISKIWEPDALAISGFSREDTLKFKTPLEELTRFAEWIKATNVGSPRFLADNAGFDWMFIAWYFHTYLGYNPFGFSSTSLTSLFKGLKKDFYAKFKYLRKTKHSHNALDDAMGNAEVLQIAQEKYDLKIKLN